MIPRPLSGLVALCVAVAGAACAPEGGNEANFSRPTTAVELLDHAKALFYQPEIDSTWNLLTVALDAAREEQDVSLEAEVLTWLGMTARKREDYPRARELGELALNLKHDHVLVDQFARSYNALGLLAWEEYRLGDARRLLDSAVLTGNAAGNSLIVAAAEGNRGLVLLELGDFDGARRRFALLRDVGHTLDSARFEANGLANLAMLSTWEGDPAAALPMLYRANELYRTINYRKGLQHAFAQLGAAYAAMGEPASAFEATDSALTIARELGSKTEEARNLEVLAWMHAAGGNHRWALTLYREAQSVYRDLAFAEETASVQRKIAELHAATGNFQEARSGALRALVAHRDAGLLLEQLDDHVLLAALASTIGDPRVVSAHLADAARVAEQIDTPAAWIAVAVATAEDADRREETPAVLRALDPVFTQLADAVPATQLRVLGIYARSLMRVGDFDSAAAVGRRAVEITEQVRERFGTSILRSSFVQERSKIYADFVQTLLRLGRIEEAWQVADAARGQTLGETTPRRKAFTDNARGRERNRLLQRIDRFAAARDSMQRFPFLFDSVRFAAVTTQLQSARAQYEGLFIESGEVTAANRTPSNTRRLDLDEMQSSLRPDEVLIEYLVTSDRIELFVARDTIIRTFDYPMAEVELASRVRVARELLADPSVSSELSSEVLQDLHDALIAPVLRAGVLSGARRLTIVPHTVLNYLSFAALQDRVTGRYLVQDYVVTRIPVAIALPALRARASATSNSSVRKTLFAPLAASLPFTREETRAIKRQGGAREYVDRRATEKRVREALERGDIVHLATHGVMNARNPLFSRIKLTRKDETSTDNGRLEVHEIINLNIASPLVFLSGCETGVGAAWSTQFARGEDYATLAQAFLYAGAQNVVSTLWRIEDEGAAVFGATYYEALRDDPATALATAQRALLADKRFSAPYYWAAYQIAGSGKM